MTSFFNSVCVTLGRYPVFWVLGDRGILDKSLDLESEEDFSSQLCHFLDRKLQVSHAALRTVITQGRTGGPGPCDDTPGVVQCTALMAVHVNLDPAS